MGKKITSSSPLDTLAFDAIPSTWQYSNAITKHSYTPSSPSYGGGASGRSPYTSTNTNTDLTGDEKPCPPGKHMENGTCVKNKKTSRGSRLKKGIAEDEALGKTASAARKRKRLAGWQTAQEKRTKQIVDHEKTFGGRLISNISTAFQKGYDADGDGKIDANEKKMSRHDLKVEGAAKIKKEEGKVKKQAEIDKCNNTSGKKWDTAKGCIDLAKTNFNPVSTSSTNLSSITTSLIGTGIKKQSQKPCPKGQTRVGKFCI